MRILIADDHSIARRYIREALEEEGWEVCGEAATGREAVAMNAELKPDIVVLDLSMPEGNGLEAATEIHKEFPDTEKLELVVPYLKFAVWCLGCCECETTGRLRIALT